MHIESHTIHQFLGFIFDYKQLAKDLTFASTHRRLALQLLHLQHEFKRTKVSPKFGDGTFKRLMNLFSSRGDGSRILFFNRSSGRHVDAEMSSSNIS